MEIPAFAGMTACRDGVRSRLAVKDPAFVMTQTAVIPGLTRDLTRDGRDEVSTRSTNERTQIAL